MAGLKSMGVIQPFPEWELWGVVIEPPRELREGLSPVVRAGVQALAAKVSTYISQTLAEIPGEEECPLQFAIDPVERLPNTSS